MTSDTRGKINFSLFQTFTYSDGRREDKRVQTKWKKAVHALWHLQPQAEQEQFFKIKEQK
jgi:hypothetical protein